ncbi:radical SAM protein [Leptolyngbya sp. 'hensonii']|uniref:radical SAM protein n=1 Tax=Leptolyngbya sp. 'hensonii' TaxID=1922337 RepID=UPI00094FED2B|nr:radical SAM protein [Leptolyngbya sp. 'hensonii']OLP16689.1 radical SAM protein [Leptolyngbya sp. 'hensonii']
MSDVVGFPSVYGPVQSWRFGRSLGIDPIGPCSTCSFNCVYCQLGEIEHQHGDRQIFIPTAQIQSDLGSFQPWEVDIITLSGSGEPTLALNLGEIIVMAKAMTSRPVGVLTNGTLLANLQVQADLAIADQVAVKIDAISGDQLHRVNRPIAGMHLVDIWTGLQQFRSRYPGILAIQTMILSPWSHSDQSTYIRLMQEFAPDEIQLNTPTRPKPITHQLAARGNDIAALNYPIRRLNPIRTAFLQEFGAWIYGATGIPVRYPATEGGN